MRLHISRSERLGMSYEAFDLVRLVDKLPLKICAIAAWGEPRTLAYSALIRVGGH